MLADLPVLTFNLTKIRGAMKRGYRRTNITKDIMAPEFGEKLKGNVNNKRRKCETFFLDQLDSPITEQLSEKNYNKEGR